MDADQLELNALMQEFPVGRRLALGDNTMFVMGWFGHDQLILADRDPHDDYNLAVKSCWSYQANIFRTKH